MYPVLCQALGIRSGREIFEEHNEYRAYEEGGTMGRN